MLAGCLKQQKVQGCMLRVSQMMTAAFWFLCFAKIARWHWAVPLNQNGWVS